MDNLTHTLIGVAVARQGLDRRVTGSTLTLALASNLPDLDLVSAMGGAADYLEHHRGLSHAFAASPVLAGALALALAFWPNSTRRLGPTFLVAWLGVIVHIVADLWTSYGTRALLPFDRTWYAWDWIFIVDPVLLGLLLLACFGSRWTGWKSAPHAFLLLVLAYVGLRAGAHAMAEGEAVRLAGPAFERVRAFPDPISLNRWRFLASSPTTFGTGYVTATGSSRSLVTFPRQLESPLARRIARESAVARVFLDFSAFPRFEERREGDLTVLVWRDLRFTDRRANGFLCEVRVDARGSIVSERMIF